MQPEEQRENVRIKDRLHIAYRLIEPEDRRPAERADKFFPVIWTKYPNSVILEEAEEAGFKILPHIIELNRKIDTIVELLIHENKPQVEIPPSRDVCISASGIKVSIGEPSNPGQKVALCIIIPFAPPTKIFVMGEVTRSVSLDPLLNEGAIIYETGIRFLDLGEEDYEKIIRYVFKRQRDQLKDKKRLTIQENSHYNEGE
jgi:hypothetical protein